MGWFVLGLLTLLAVPLAMLFAIFVLWTRVGALQDRVRLLEQGDARAVEAEPEHTPVPRATMPASAPARVVRRAAEPAAPIPPPTIDASAPSGEALPTPSGAPAFAGFESLIGGRLPVWIGGAALVLAGFFLVRHSIEAGLLGPGVRVVLAALFAMLLVAGAEVARRSRHVADDPRIAQALAGAGVASAYGTLYMAAELYGLVGAGTAFALMLAITAAALALALRHGPPTAAMGLIGGFAAPLVTGYDAGNLVPLLAYLALFTSALFALAIVRGWTWLAVAAAGAGFTWSLALIALIDGPAAGAIGPFILLLAIGASVAGLRTPGLAAPLAIAPVVIGLAQLMLLAPRLDFGPLAWSLYGLLAAAALVLAARDPRMRIAAAIAVVFALAMLALGMAGDARSAVGAAIAYALLFAGTGHWLARRAPHQPLWDAIALAGSAGPWMIVWLWHITPPPGLAMLATALLGAGSAAAIAIRARDRRLGLLAPLAAFGLVVAGLGEVIASVWLPLVAASGAIALGLWDRKRSDGDGGAVTIGWIVAVLLGAPVFVDYLAVLVASLSGARMPYLELPGIGEGVRALAPPIVAAAVLLRIDPRAFGRSRALVLTIASIAGGALVYHLAKLPLAIDTDARFVTLGFTERALLTQLLFAAAWLAARHEGWRRIAQGAAALALARIVWFDLLALNPIMVDQAVGEWPVFNAATLHASASALWLWLLSRTLPPERWWRRLSMAATLLAALVLVRQASHGTLLTGDFGQGETWLYSAAMLALAIGWLWRGIRSGARDLRLAGLGLLTVTTIKVFVVDAAALDGVLRILGFLGLGVALIAIGWAYNKVLRAPAAPGTAADNQIG